MSWGMQLIHLASGLFSVSAQASQIIVRNLLNFTFFVCQALAQSSGSLIGRTIGKGDIKEAKRYYDVANRSSLTIMSFLTLLMLFFQDNLIDLYLNKKGKNIQKTIDQTKFIFTIFSPLRNSFNWYII